MFQYLPSAGLPSNPTQLCVFYIYIYIYIKERRPLRPGLYQGTDLGRVQRNLCSIEFSQKHVVSVTLNGRSLKQPGLFLELAFWPNWEIDGEGPCLNLMVTLVELHDHICRWKHTWNLQKKHLKYPQTASNKIPWSDEPQFKASSESELESERAFIAEYACTYKEFVLVS